MNKKKFVEFLFRKKAVLLGNFVTKSNRSTPYFFNLGKLYTSNDLQTLGKFYTNQIWQSVKLHEFKSIPNVVFGPTYKGIPLSISTVIGLGKKWNNIAYSFNRKEIKSYGDKGVLVGKELNASDRVVIIDDVITSGISILDSIKIIHNFNAKVVGIVVAVDRQEPLYQASSNNKNPKNSLTALDYLAKKYKIPIKALISIEDFFSLAFKYGLIEKKTYQQCLNYLYNNK